MIEIPDFVDQTALRFFLEEQRRNYQRRRSEESACESDEAADRLAKRCGVRSWVRARLAALIGKTKMLEQMEIVRR